MLFKYGLSRFRGIISIVLVLAVFITLASGCSMGMPTYNFGYIDREGNFVIEPKFGNALPFREGLAAVLYGTEEYGKWGYIDIEGNSVIPPEYDRTRGFSEGFAPVMIEEGRNAEFWRFIDKEGNFVNESKYIDASIFVDGLAPVKDIETQLYGYVDTGFNFVIPPNFDIASVFSEDYALYTVGVSDNAIAGFISKTGEIVIEAKYTYCGAFSEGLSAVKLSASETRTDWGYIDKEGNMVIEPRFGYAGSFNDGLAPVKIDAEEQGKWGFINTKGELVIEAKFGYALSFSEGLAAVLDGTFQKGSWGYIDTEGNFVIEPRFNAAGEFASGYAPASVEEK